MDKFKKAMLQSVVSDLIYEKDITNGRFNQDIDDYLEQMELLALQQKYRERLSSKIQGQMLKQVARRYSFKKGSYDKLHYFIGSQGVDVESSQSEDSDSLYTETDVSQSQELLSEGVRRAKEAEEGRLEEVVEQGGDNEGESAARERSGEGLG